MKWKLVPVEPTPEMVWKAEEDSPEFHHGDPWYGSEPPSEGQIRAIYTAMLEAAPPAPSVPDGWKNAAEWLRNNYQDYPSISSLCEAMVAQSANNGGN